jgi:hypothetical protein
MKKKHPLRKTLDNFQKKMRNLVSNEDINILPNKNKSVIVEKKVSPSPNGKSVKTVTIYKYHFN